MKLAALGFVLGSFAICAAALLWGASFRDVASGWLFCFGAILCSGAFAYFAEGGRLT